MQLFNSLDIPFIPVEWYGDAFILPSMSAHRLSQLPEYDKGIFYVQNVSSMIPPLVLSPKRGEFVLDIAAAPGSKTTQLAALMNNTGKIVANDTSSIRMETLRVNLQKLGVENVRPQKKPAQILWKDYPEMFDKVLVDVPCSMEGTIQMNIPKTFEYWSSKRVKELSKMQRWILRSAVSCAKPGGVIVYSTCTLSPEENEDVIEWILRKENGAVITEPAHIFGLNTDPGITSWKTKTYKLTANHLMRILPDQSMEGFFVAKLRKIRTTVPSA